MRQCNSELMTSLGNSWALNTPMKLGQPRQQPAAASTRLGVRPNTLCPVSSNMMLAWPGSEHEASDDFTFFVLAIRLIV